jgi:hypothetical protein
MWTYDLAREQAPSLDHLRRICRVTQEAGYNALGLYLEHRFAYPSVPWAHGENALTPETAQALIREFPDLQIIPFVNLLGHFEGLLYSLGGQRFAEHYFKGMQACPSNPDFLGLAESLLKDTLNTFNSEIVMIGGDETWQLGQCTVCQARVEAFEAMNPGADGKALLYADHFARLAEFVLEAGRRPAIWGDMFADHPSALPLIPTNTVIFDWQYFRSPRESSRQFFEAGHEVVFCPSIQTYNASWSHLPQSELNVKEHIAAAKDLNAKGVCVTTWEMALFGSYETMLPAIKAAGEMMDTVEASSRKGKTPEEYRATKEAPNFMCAYLKESETYEEWARLMGIELQQCGGLFSYGGLRSPLKARFLLYSNPFLLWMRNREDLCGLPGDKALEVLDRAISVAPDSAARGISEFVRIAIEFARAAESAHMEYSAGHPGKAVAALTHARASFDDLAHIAKGTHLRIGGSLADIERCRVAKEHVERVMRRIRDYGDGSLGYMPSFETITHPKFVPHDQGNWWLINSWANE